MRSTFSRALAIVACAAIVLAAALNASANDAKIRLGTVEIFPVSDHYTECFLGHIPGTTCVELFGDNEAVGTSAEDVWDGGGMYSAYPTTAATIRCDSDSAQDTAGSTGARNVTVQGLDANWDEQTVTYIPNGLTAVTISGTWMRIFRAFATQAGSVGANDGILFCEDSTTGDGVPSNDDFMQIEPGRGHTLMAIFTTAAGTASVLRSPSATTAKNDDAEISVYIRDNTVADASWQVLVTGRVYQSHWEMVTFYSTLGAKTDIRVEASAGTGTIDVSAAFLLDQVDL